MKLLLGNLILTGVLISQVSLTQAQDTLLTQAYLAEIVGKARASYKVPAIAVTLMNADEITLQEIQGIRVVDKPAPATLDDFFHIGSCSKSVLAVIAAQLIAQGKISWQTKFFDLFPELKASARDAYGDITLEDLFLCRAGIKAFTDAATEPLPEFGPDVTDQRYAFIHYLLQQPPASAQKENRFAHLYSNAGYTIVAAMLERASGLDYETLVRKLLTDEMGIAFHIGWPNSISPDQPWGHLISKDTIEPLAPDHPYRLPFLLTPAGDLSMTPGGFARYTQLHLQGLRGSGNCISSPAYRHIHFGHQGFSLGVANGSHGGKQFSGFDGSAGTFFCRAILVPEENFALTIMTNAGSGTSSMAAVDWLTMKIVKKQFDWWWKFWL